MSEAISITDQGLYLSLKSWVAVGRNSN